MFRNLKPLNINEHNRLRFIPIKDLEFARHVTHVPVHAAEMAQLSKDHVMVFSTGESCVPQVLLGVTKDENLFMSDEGLWKGDQIPASIRQYPFATQPIEDNSFAIVFDEASECFSEKEGKLLFNKSGKNFKPSPLLKEIEAQLNNLYKNKVLTNSLCQELKENDVLEQQSIIIKDDNSKPIKVSGFAVVNWEKVSKLSDEKLASWARSGLLNMIFSHLRSLKNASFLYKLYKEKEASKTKTKH